MQTWARLGWRSIALLALAASVPACSGSKKAGGADGGTTGVTGWPVQFGADDWYATAVAADKQGNVYVAGSAGLLVDAGDASAFFVGKYDPSGMLLWQTVIADRACSAMALDIASGAVYVAAGGVLVNGHGSAVLIKLDAAGKQVWEQTLGSTTPGLQAGGAGARAVTVDPSGNPVIAGVSDVPLPGASPVAVGNGDLLVAKYDPSGALQWVTLLGSAESATTPGISDYANGVAADPQGNIYVAADVYGTVGGQTSAGMDDFGIAKFDPTGKNLWVREIGSASIDEPLGVAVDTAGNVYAAGTTQGDFDGHTSAGDHDVAVVKLDTNGTKAWSQQIGGAASDVATGIALDAAGKPVLAGNTEGNFDGFTSSRADYLPLILVKYDAAGSKLFSAEFGGDQGAEANGIAIDPLREHLRGRQHVGRPRPSPRRRRSLRHGLRRRVRRPLRRHRQGVLTRGRAPPYPDPAGPGSGTTRTSRSAWVTTLEAMVPIRRSIPCACWRPMTIRSADRSAATCRMRCQG